MRYNKLKKTRIEPSVLGMGTMRLPTKDNSDNGEVDVKAAVDLIENAIQEGINYYDTAWPYHKGKSEDIVGSVLSNHKREGLYIATKAPVWDINTSRDFNYILNAQLKKLKTDYIDFYMLHALGNTRWQHVINKNIMHELESAKKNGILKNIGFSFHDNYDVFKKIVDEYDYWDFCQIQYNYRDIDKQAGTRGLEYASNKGLDIIVMEPLKGGELVDLPHQVANVFPGYKTTVEWGLDFLWDKPEIGVVLSGISSNNELYENIKYANRSSVGMLSEAEHDVYFKAKKIFDNTPMVSCTKCNYCICPSGLLIPKLIEAYNMVFSKDYTKAKEYYDGILLQADSCVSCKCCEKHCPQKIEISRIMVKVKKIFTNPVPEIDLEALRMKWPDRYEKIMEKLD